MYDDSIPRRRVERVLREAYIKPKSARDESNFVWNGAVLFVAKALMGDKFKLNKEARR